jgi:hypothetical protein
MIIHKIIYGTCLTVGCSMELREGGRGKGNDRASVMSYSIRCGGGGLKDVY